MKWRQKTKGWLEYRRHQAPVVQKLGRAIHWINHYPGISFRETNYCAIQWIVIYLASVFQRLDSAIHRINLYSMDSAISFPQIILMGGWIVIYPVDSTIQRLNNWGLVDSIIHLLNSWGQVYSSKCKQPYYLKYRLGT